MKKCFSDFFKRFDFMILTLCLVSFHLPYLNSIVIPQHDTRSIFEFFYFFYNEFFFSGKLAQWMPYYSFGIPSSYFQLYALTPSSYFSFLIGWLFGIIDVLWLFKISVFGEHLIFLLGMYLLCRQIFIKRRTTFLVCLGSICAPDYWYFQLFFSFRIFYMFPFAAYFLVMFFKCRKAFYFWLSGIVVMAWMSGNAQYFVVLWAFILFILGIIFLMGDKSLWRCLLDRSVSNILLGASFFIIAGAYFYQLKDLTSFVRIVSRGSGGGNSLGMFLTYGANIGYLKAFVIKHIFASDSEGYVGLFSVIFFVWALLKVRSRACCAFLTSTFVLMAISFGGVFAAIFYFLPGLSYYRHIGHVYGFIKILFLLVSGFGLDHFWATPMKTRIFLMLVILGILIVLLDCLGISGEKLAAWSLSESPLGALWTSMEIGGASFRIAIYFVGFILILLAVVRIKMDINSKWQIIYNERARAVVSIIMICCVMDILSFQVFLYRRMKKSVDLPSLAYVTKIHPLQFQEQRLWKPEQPRARDALAWVAGAGGISYGGVYSFVQFDPCKSEFREDFSPLGLDRLFLTRKNFGMDLFGVLGCDAPKLRLVSSAVLVNTLDEAIQIMKNSSEIFNQTILRLGEKKSSDTFSYNLPGGSSEGKVSVRKFNANELIADVDVHGGAGGWLVYADSFHPGWKAFVNEKSTPIYEAYLAFKAIRLDKGHNAVRFVFCDKLGFIMSCFISFFGFIMAGIFFMMVLISTFWDSNFFVKE